MKAPGRADASRTAKRSAGEDAVRLEGLAERQAPTAGKRTAAPSRDRPPPGQSRAAAPRRGLFARFLALFTDLGDPEWEKRRQLKLIERQLHASRQRFYNPRRSQVLPGLAVFFHGIYKVLAPARTLIGRAESSNLLRTLLIESSLSESQKRLHADLQDEAIAERSRRAAGADVGAEVKADLEAFVAGFDAEKIRAINLAYGHLMALLDLVHFDFYFFLRKFDSTLPEANFTVSPHFAAIDAGYVVEDLRELWDCILALDATAEWNPLLEVLKSYRDVEIIPRDGWKRVLQAVTQLKRSRLLELIIKHAEGDPGYRPRPAVHGERIVDAYLQKFRTQVELASQRVASDQRGRRVEELARLVFGSPPAQKLRNYAERSNAELRGLVTGGYTQTVPLNYLFAYLQDHFDKEMRPVVDLLLIRGKWTANQVSQQVSEALHTVLQHRDRLLKLDQDLDEEGDVGLRLATALRRAERDRSAVSEIRKTLQEVNATARQIMVGIVRALIALGKSVKDLIEDRDRKRGELIVNWRELDAEMPRGMREAMVAAYRRLYHLVQLMQLFARS